MPPSETPTLQPWWRFGYVWMVLAGPALVVLASLITLLVAIKMPDPVVDEDYYRKGVEMNRTLAQNPNSLAPAVQARNHAQTGVKSVTPIEPAEPQR